MTLCAIRIKSENMVRKSGKIGKIINFIGENRNFHIVKHYDLSIIKSKRLQRVNLGYLIAGG